MGKIISTITAIIITTFVVGLYMMASYNSSPDENKTQFMTYNDTGTYGHSGGYTNLSSQNTSFSYQETSSNRENLNTIGQAVMFQIASSTAAYNSAGDPISKLSAAFGIINAFVIGVGQILLAVVIQGTNMVFGLTANLYNLPNPWNFIAMIGVVGVVMLFLTMILRVVNFLRGNEPL